MSSVKSEDSAITYPASLIIAALDRRKARWSSAVSKATKLLLQVSLALEFARCRSDSNSALASAGCSPDKIAKHLVNGESLLTQSNCRRQGRLFASRHIETLFQTLFWLTQG